MSAFLSLKPDFSNLDDLLKKYDDILEGAEEKLNPVGKSLKEANSAVPTDYLLFAQSLQELKSMERFAENVLQQKKAEGWSRIKENSNIDHNTRDLEVMCKNTPAYQKLYLIHI